MAAPAEIVVTLDGGVVDAGAPVAHAEDPAFLRGDGVFETLLLRDGRPCLVEAHLARLARSAAVIGLPSPAPDSWRAALRLAAAQWADTGDAVVRLVLGRGRGAVGPAFVTVSELPARVAAARRDGVSAVTLERGRSALAPWSTVTAKSLSYAGSAAAVREAHRLGADEAILLDGDGWVLEGPRSSLVIVDDDGALATPPQTAPILPGTTVQAVFVLAATRGVTCARRPIKVIDLVAAQGVWLLSSVTLAARVYALDGVELATGPTSVQMAPLVDEAILGDGCAPP